MNLSPRIIAAAVDEYKREQKFATRKAAIEALLKAGLAMRPWNLNPVSGQPKVLPYVAIKPRPPSPQARPQGDGFERVQTVFFPCITPYAVVCSEADRTRGGFQEPLVAADG